MTHPQDFGQKFTPIRRFFAWKTHPFWPHIPNMTQYGSPPPGPYHTLFLLVPPKFAISPQSGGVLLGIPTYQFKNIQTLNQWESPI